MFYGPIKGTMELTPRPPTADAIEHERSERIFDALERRPRFLFVPCYNGVQHAENRQRTEARVEVAPKFPFFDPRAQHVFKYSFDRAGMAADPVPTFGRQMSALIQKDVHVVAPVPQRVEMRGDEGTEFIARRARLLGDADCRLDEAFGAARADHFKRDFLRRKIIVEARLAHAQYVGDVLRGGSVKSTPRENLGGGIDDFRGSAAVLARRGQLTAGPALPFFHRSLG
ncbi:MAG: hypothetical protein WD871_00060 [Xanthobacteraceae bacterium]